MPHKFDRFRGREDNKYVGSIFLHVTLSVDSTKKLKFL